MSLELIIGLVVLAALGVWFFWPNKKESEQQIQAPWPFPVSQPPQSHVRVEEAPAAPAAPVAAVAEPEVAPKKAPAKKPRKTAAKKATKKVAK